MANFLTSPVQALQADGKAIALNDLPDEAWTIIKGGYTDTEVARLYKAVPWLFRGAHLRAQAVSKTPFTITNVSGSVVDTSKDYQNKVGFLPNIRRLLYLYESSLTMEGCAYLIKNAGARSKKIKELQYLHPASIRPKFDDSGVVLFERALGVNSDESRILLPKEMVWSFFPDYSVEIGPGTSPGRAAIVASGVLDSGDQFVRAFFLRGAIKATLLMVENEEYTDAEELSRLKSWWRRVFSGTKSMWNAHVVNARVKPVVIGEGLEALNNSSLTREKREDVAVALGIPQSLLFSDAANFATAQQDDLHFYDKTIRPEVELIQEDWNERLFLPLGYRIDFNLDGLDVFQEDENERSTAYRNYVDTGMRPSVAAQIVGLDLPDGVEYTDLDEEWEARQQAREAAADALQQAGLQTDNAQTGSQTDEGKTSEMLADLARWQRKAIKAVKEGKAVPDFKSDVIPSALWAALSGLLESAKTPEEVKTVFTYAADWQDYP